MAGGNGRRIQKGHTGNSAVERGLPDIEHGTPNIEVEGIDV